MALIRANGICGDGTGFIENIFVYTGKKQRFQLNSKYANVFFFLLEVGGAGSVQT